MQCKHAGSAVRWRNVVAACAGVVVLSSCSVLPLYNQELDTVATGAKKAYDDARVTETLKVEHENLRRLAQREAVALDTISRARRDERLLAIAQERRLGEGLKTRIDTRLNEIVTAPDRRELPAVFAGSDDCTSQAGKPASKTGVDCLASLPPLVRIVAHARREEKEIRAGLLKRSDKFAKLPACVAPPVKDGLADPAGSDPFIKTLTPTEGAAYQTYYDACTTLVQQTARLESVSSSLKGTYAGVQKEAGAFRNKLAQNKAEAAAALSEAKAAATSYLEATKKAKSGADAPDLKPVQDALAKLEKLDAIGVQILSDEQLANIQKLLGALGSKTTDAKDDKGATAAGASSDPAVDRAVAFLSTSNSLRVEVERYVRAEELPHLAPLLIEKQRLEVRNQFARRQVELAERRVALAEEKQLTLVNEIEKLVQARAEVQRIAGAQAPNCAKPLVNKAKEALYEPYCAPAEILSDQKVPLTRAYAVESDPNSEPARRALYRATLLYADSLSDGQGHLDRLDSAIIDTQYEESLNRSEFALQTWDALIATPITQLQAHYTTGVKPEVLAQLLQAAGLGSIAARIK